MGSSIIQMLTLAIGQSFQQQAQLQQAQQQQAQPLLLQQQQAQQQQAQQQLLQQQQQQAQQLYAQQQQYLQQYAHQSAQHQPSQQNQHAQYAQHAQQTQSSGLDLSGEVERVKRVVYKGLDVSLLTNPGLPGENIHVDVTLGATPGDEEPLDSSKSLENAFEASVLINRT